MQIVQMQTNFLKTCLHTIFVYFKETYNLQIFNHKLVDY